jgi:hypothetical protein
MQVPVPHGEQGSETDQCDRRETPDAEPPRDEPRANEQGVPEQRTRLKSSMAMSAACSCRPMANFPDHGVGRRHRRS